MKARPSVESRPVARAEPSSACVAVHVHTCEATSTANRLSHRTAELDGCADDVPRPRPFMSRFVGREEPSKQRVLCAGAHRLPQWVGWLSPHRGHGSSDQERRSTTTRVEYFWPQPQDARWTFPPRKALVSGGGETAEVVPCKGVASMPCLQRVPRPSGRVSELRAPMGPLWPPLGVARSLILVLSRGWRCFALEPVVNDSAHLRAWRPGCAIFRDWLTEFSGKATYNAEPASHPAGEREPARGRRSRVDMAEQLRRRMDERCGFALGVACRRGGWVRGRGGVFGAVLPGFRSAVGRWALGRAGADRGSGAPRLLLTSLPLRSACDWTAAGGVARLFWFVGKSNSSSGVLTRAPFVYFVVVVPGECVAGSSRRLRDGLVGNERKMKRPEDERPKRSVRSGERRGNGRGAVTSIRDG